MSTDRPDESELVKAWDVVADEWAERVRTASDQNREYLLDPTTLALLGDIAGRRVLDVGCGEGRFTRMLTERGAKVVAVDYSPRMIELAQEEERRRPLGVSYHLADVADLSFLDAESFDVAVAYMSLMDVADYQAAIAEVARLLKPGSQFVFSILHPCFTMKDAGWERRVPSSSGDADKLYYRVDNYFERAHWLEKIWPAGTAKTPLFHRPLGDYAAALRKSGFVIRELVEPTPDSTLAEHLDVSGPQESQEWVWHEYFRIPLFIVLDCVKAA